MTGKLFKIISAEKPFLVRCSLLYCNKTVYHQNNCQMMSDMAQKLLLDSEFSEDTNNVHLAHLQLLAHCLVEKIVRNLDSFTYSCILLIHSTIRYQAFYPSHKSCQSLVTQGTVRRGFVFRRLSLVLQLGKEGGTTHKC